MKPQFTTIFCLLLCTNVFCQSKKSYLSNEFQAADSIVLVSHLGTINSFTKDSKGNQISPPKLLIKGKLNQSIIKERIQLSDSLEMDLEEILIKKRDDNKIEVSKCFITPHHAILIYKKGKISYIDICFTCNRFLASKSLDMTDEEFNEQWWDQLNSFFRERGFTYKMTEDPD